MLYATRSADTRRDDRGNFTDPLRRRHLRRKLTAAVVGHLQHRIRRYAKRRDYGRDAVGSQTWREWTAFLTRDGTDDKDFRAHYRLPKAVFDELLGRIRHRIAMNADKQKNAARAPIDPETMLAVTLRWLAGACS